jgi:hypothetical protein
MAWVRARRIVGAIGLVLSTLVTHAAAQDVAYTGGVQFATGRYLFETRTNSVYVLSGLDVAAGPLRLAASIPVVVQSTPWITSGPVPLPAGGQQAGELTRQMGRGHRRIVLPATGLETLVGFGDPLLRGEVELVRDAPNHPSVRVLAGAKPPLASIDDGFSTGAWDYGTGVSVSKRAGVHSFSADASFWHFGDLEELPLKDAWSYSASYGRVLAGGRWSLFVSGSGFTTIIDGQDPPVQIALGIGRAFSSRRALTGMLSFGVTDTAPDVTVGIGWRLSL